jgi:ABC-type transporter Mla MlaB component
MKSYQLPEKIIVTQITKLLKQINQKIDETNNITFDLSNVKLIDSAGVALLVYLKSKYQNVKFLNSTIQIDNLCQLYKIQL